MNWRQFASSMNALALETKKTASAFGNDHSTNEGPS